MGERKSECRENHASRLTWFWHHKDLSRNAVERALGGIAQFHCSKDRQRAIRAKPRHGLRQRDQEE